MKKRLTLLFTFTFTLVFSQVNQAESDGPIINFDRNMIGGSYNFVEPKPTKPIIEEKDIIGSFYLFDNWKNESRITSMTGRVYNIVNLNFHLHEEKFLVKVSKDSVYVYNRLKEVSINNMVFFNIKGKYYTRILNDNKIQLYKRYHGKLKQPLLNKMTSQRIRKARYVKMISYYLKMNEEFRLVVLKEKKILKFFKEELQNKIKNWVEKEGLSYENEKDVLKIFSYYASL